MNFAQDLQSSEQAFINLSESLGDKGIEGSALIAWERVARSARMGASPRGMSKM